MNDFLEIIDYYYDHPVAFFEEVLGMIPDDWQKKVLNDLVVYPKISVRSGQGVGYLVLGVQTVFKGYRNSSNNATAL